MEFLRNGDSLVVWKLDRLGRSLKHLVGVIGDLDKRGIGFQSLTEGIDTTSDSGRLTFHIFASLAEFERALIRERTRAGLAAARARGRNGGRPRAFDAKKLEMARMLMADHKKSVSDVCKALNVSRSTLYRYLEVEEP
jgi:DNA invertase Pin-like site-specific DNA recombinase